MSLHDDVMADVEPQTGSLARRFGGEERIEHLGQRVGRDPVSRIPDAHHHPRFLQRRPHRQLAAPVHGGYRIVDDVGPHLVQLAAVPLDAGDVLVELAPHRHVLEPALQHHQRVIQAVVDVDRLDPGLIEVRVRLQRLDDVGGSPGAFPDLLQERAGGVGAAEAFDHAAQLRVREARRQPGEVVLRHPGGREGRGVPPPVRDVMRLEPLLDRRLEIGERQRIQVRRPLDPLADCRDRCLQHVALLARQAGGAHPALRIGELRDLAKQLLGAAQGGGHRIVQLVRHPGAQAAERRELLALPQHDLLLQVRGLEIPHLLLLPQQVHFVVEDGRRELDEPDVEFVERLPPLPVQQHPFEPVRAEPRAGVDLDDVLTLKLGGQRLTRGVQIGSFQIAGFLGAPQIQLGLADLVGRDLGDRGLAAEPVDHHGGRFGPQSGRVPAVETDVAPGKYVGYVLEPAGQQLPDLFDPGRGTDLTRQLEQRLVARERGERALSRHGRDCRAAV